MSASKTEYVVQFKRSAHKYLEWRMSEAFTEKEAAEKKYEAEKIRFPQFKHRLIRVTVLKESK